MVVDMRGYKAFTSRLQNSYGMPFQKGRIYMCEGVIRFGIQGNGYHFCKNLEDTFRYFDGMHDKIEIALVEGFGEIVSYEDDYYGYYDMYAASHLQIIEWLCRENVIDYGLGLNEIRAERFLKGYRLTDMEITLFEKKFGNQGRIQDVINLYQKNR